jgi:hypothetical protein
MTTNNTTTAVFSETTPTIEGLEIEVSEFNTIWRSAIAVLINLYYARYGKTPGYKAKVKIELVKEVEK